MVVVSVDVGGWWMWVDGGCECGCGWMVAESGWMVAVSGWWPCVWVDGGYECGWMVAVSVGVGG